MAPAAMMPRNIAIPPRVGVGCAWTLRSLGRSIAPSCVDRRHTRGVVKNDTKKATKPTVR